MVDLDTLTSDGLAQLVDHTFLKPVGDAEAVTRLCEEAREWGFATAMVSPCEVARCVRLLDGSKVRVGTVISFPLGQMTSIAKSLEIRDALDNGAREIDMVENVRALQAGDDGLVSAEFADLAAQCRSRGAVSKVILETCYLTDAQKVRACELARSAGIDFVKTSTGFGPAGATVADVALMRRTVGPGMGVKAAGGIRDWATARAMIAAGATRLGTSSGVAIVKGFRAWRGEAEGQDDGR